MQMSQYLRTDRKTFLNKKTNLHNEKKKQIERMKNDPILLNKTENERKKLQRSNF